MRACFLSIFVKQGSHYQVFGGIVLTGYMHEDPETMIWSFLADLVLLCHLGFILFAVLGSLLVIGWHRLAWIHLPAALWAAAINLVPLPCPLTRWEQALRQLAGEAGYTGGFIGHYIMPLVYPGPLSEQVIILMTVGLLAWNGVVYGFVVYFARRRRRLRGLQQDYLD